MSDLIICPEVVEFYYPTIKLGLNYNIIDQADGRGPQIVDWTYDEPEPTQEQLEVAWTQVGDRVIWRGVRRERDWKLQQSDWTQFNDVTIPNKEAWATYRQKLRDITHDFPSPHDVVWPVPPS
jgi:hypothetical protein